MLEFKSRRLPVMFLTLVLYCHCLITALPANIAVTVRLFNLLNTKSIKIEPIENDILVVKYNQSEWYELRGGSVLSADVGGDGIDVRLSNGKLTSCRNFAVHSPADKPFFISNDSIEKRLYSGNLSVGRSDDGSLNVILSCRVEAFLEQLLLSEFSSLENPEALKAVSIAMRTFIYYHLGRHKSEGYDFCDTTHCQAFKGWNTDNVSMVESYRQSITSTLAGTRKKVLSYKRKLIEGYYTACCGGRLTTPETIWGGTSEFPYRKMKSPFCSKNRFYLWMRDVPLTLFADAFGLNPSEMKFQLVRTEEGEDFVKEVAMTDGSHSINMNVTEFRREVARKFGWNKVLSHSFGIRISGDKVIFEGRGFGHSIGLCQACAAEMGRRGYSWRNILDYFYYQAEVDSIDKLKP